MLDATSESVYRHVADGLRWTIDHRDTQEDVSKELLLLLQFVMASREAKRTGHVDDLVSKLSRAIHDTEAQKNNQFPLGPTRHLLTDIIRLLKEESSP